MRTYTTKEINEAIARYEEDGHEMPAQIPTTHAFAAAKTSEERRAVVNASYAKHLNSKGYLD